VRLQFLAMERSLRASGCDLPLRVFPYDEALFDLPGRSVWFRPPLVDWLRQNKAQPMCDRYFCLTEQNYVFTDTDVIFLENPARALEKVAGFVVADTEWNKPQWTFTPASASFLAGRSSVWLQRVFNAGHFACDRALYTDGGLRETFLRSPLSETPPFHDRPGDDQPGINLFVALSGAPFTNLNLPPSPMESTWAGDYPGNYLPLWEGEGKKPYFIHWAGPALDEERPINRLFLDFLTGEEKAEWRTLQRDRLEKARRAGRWPLGVRILNRMTRLLYPRFYVQPRQASGRQSLRK